MTARNNEEVDNPENLPLASASSRKSPVVLQMTTLRANLSPEINMFNFKTHKKKSVDQANSERPTIDTSNAKG